MGCKGSRGRCKGSRGRCKGSRGRCKCNKGSIPIVRLNRCGANFIKKQEVLRKFKTGQQQ